MESVESMVVSKCRYRAPFVLALEELHQWLNVRSGPIPDRYFGSILVIRY